MASRKPSGLTLPELIIAIVIIAVFAFLALPEINGPLPRAHATRMLSNMKQLHLATQQMVLDGATTGDATLSWPGPNGFAYWATNLVPSYLGPNDFTKLMSPPPSSPPAWYDVRYWWTKPIRYAMPMANTNAVLVYQVADDSATNAVFLSSGNFTNTPTGGILNPSANPFGRGQSGDKGFVIFRKDGVGAVLLPRQVGQTNAIGSYVPLMP